MELPVFTGAIIKCLCFLTVTLAEEFLFIMQICVYISHRRTFQMWEVYCQKHCLSWNMMYISTVWQKGRANQVSCIIKNVLPYLFIVRLTYTTFFALTLQSFKPHRAKTYCSWKQCTLSILKNKSRSSIEKLYYKDSFAGVFRLK